MIFGSILGAGGGAKGPLFFLKNRFCGSSGGQDGAGALQGAPKLLKMKLQGSQNGAPEAPGALKRSPGSSQTFQIGF